MAGILICLTFFRIESNERMIHPANSNFVVLLHFFLLCRKLSSVNLICLIRFNNRAIYSLRDGEKINVHFLILKHFAKKLTRRKFCAKFSKPARSGDQSGGFLKEKMNIYFRQTI